MLPVAVNCREGRPTSVVLQPAHSLRRHGCVIVEGESKATETREQNS